MTRSQCIEGTRTHDYTRPSRGWGHDLTYRPIDDSGRKLEASGWGSGISAGDYFLLSNGESDTRYCVESISDHRDPPDMWRATLVFAPRGPVASGQEKP